MPRLEATLINGDRLESVELTKEDINQLSLYELGDNLKNLFFKQDEGKVWIPADKILYVQVKDGEQ